MYFFNPYRNNCKIYLLIKNKICSLYSQLILDIICIIDNIKDNVNLNENESISVSDLDRIARGIVIMYLNRFGKDSTSPYEAGQLRFIVSF